MDFGNDKGKKDGWVTQEAKFQFGKSSIFAFVLDVESCYWLTFL